MRESNEWSVLPHSQSNFHVDIDTKAKKIEKKKKENKKKKTKEKLCNKRIIFFLEFICLLFLSDCRRLK